MDPYTLNTILKGGFKSELDIKHFFTETRLLLERIGSSAEECKVVKFYADWMLHIKKDNLDGMREYFKVSDEMLNRNEIMPDRNKLNKQIEAFTSFDELRKQLKIFLTRCGVDCDFLESDKEWRIFSSFLRNLILRKPILFKKFKSSGTRRKMMLFMIDTKAPIMGNIENAIYWILFISTSKYPLVGIIPESVGLK